MFRAHTASYTCKEAISVLLLLCMIRRRRNLPKLSLLYYYCLNLLRLFSFTVSTYSFATSNDSQQDAFCSTVYYSFDFKKKTTENCIQLGVNNYLSCSSDTKKQTNQQTTLFCSFEKHFLEVPIFEQR